MADISSISGKTKVDNETIEFNQNNELFAVNSAVMLGDFESGFGDWSLNNSTGASFSRVTDSPENTFGSNTCLKFRVYNVGLRKFTRTADLSGIDQLVVYYRHGTDDSGDEGTSNDEFRFEIDGNVLITATGGQDSTWKKAVVDVSSYGRNSTLAIVNDYNSGTNGFQVRADIIHGLSGVAVPPKFTDNSSGGTNE